MPKKKKNDFWDDDQVVSYESQEETEADEPEKDEEWSMFKSTPVKVIMRILLMISCLVALWAGNVIYQYVQDRNASGSYSADFYDSQSFADAYSNSISQLIKMIGAMEADTSVTSSDELMTTMVENYMGKDTNFSFLIQDKNHYLITESGDDAKDRIEASNHYVVITDTDGSVTVKTSLSDSLLPEDTWTEELGQDTGEYIIYTAVDNELTYQDSFYEAQQNFEKMGTDFGIARIIGIVAIVIFVICLIFCVMATGQRRGYDGVYLGWADRVFTELAVIIMVGVAAVLIVFTRRFIGMDGSRKYIGYVLLLVSYGWITRSYFSIVRRIKAGRLFRNSITGQICRGISATVGRLPYPLNAIIEAILLILVNAFFVWLCIFHHSYEVQGVPLAYIVTGFAAVIEIIGLLSYATGGMSTDKEEETETEALPEPGSEEKSAMEQLSADVAAEKAAGENAPADGTAEGAASAAADAIAPSLDFEEAPDWETMDLSQVIQNAEQEKKAEKADEDTHIYSTDAAEKRLRQAHAYDQKTQVLSDEEMADALRASGMEPEGATEETTAKEAADTAASGTEQAGQAPAAEPAEEVGRVNFVQLNKEIRKRYRPALKSRGIIVAMRAPEKPVIVDIDKSSLSILISNVFDQIERLSDDNVRNVLEAYTQDGKVVYIAKINVADDLMEEAEAAQTDGSFDAARKIVEGNDGRFVAALKGNLLRVGMLMESAEEG